MDSKHLPNIWEENELEKKNKNHQENYMKPHKGSLYNGNIILEAFQIINPRKLSKETMQVQ